MLNISPFSGIILPLVHKNFKIFWRDVTSYYSHFYSLEMFWNLKKKGKIFHPFLGWSDRGVGVGCTTTTTPRLAPSRAQDQRKTQVGATQHSDHDVVVRGLQIVMVLKKEKKISRYAITNYFLALQIDHTSLP